MHRAPSPSSEALRQAFDHCIAVTRAHYENFPVGSFLIPAGLRPHVCAIYAFARAADDFADEPGLQPAERLARLADWRERLHRCLEAPDGLVFTALAETVRTHTLPLELLDDLLTAFIQDVTVQRHDTFDDLLAYCRYSAVPVGRLVLHLFGCADAQRLACSDAVCSALQLANFWQDIGVDCARGRIYLPQQEMQAFGVTEEDLKAARVTDAFRDLLALEVDRTEAIFYNGVSLPEQVSGRLKYELRTTWLGGMEILRKIRHSGYDVFRDRPTVTKRDAVRLLARSLFPLRQFPPAAERVPGDAGHDRCRP